MNVQLKIPRMQDVPGLLIAWVCCGLSAGFFLWTSMSSSVDLQQVPIGLGRYFYFMPFGLAAGTLVITVLWVFGLDRRLADTGLYALLLYAGALKSLGWTPLPWIALGAVVLGLVSRRGAHLEIRWTLLLLHVMGSFAGIYLAFQLVHLLGPWILLGEAIRSLWLLAFG